MGRTMWDTSIVLPGQKIGGKLNMLKLVETALAKDQKNLPMGEKEKVSMQQFLAFLNDKMSDERDSFHVR